MSRPGRDAAFWRARYWKDPEKQREKMRRLRRKHIDKRRAYDRQRYREDADRRAWQKVQATEWAKRNPGKRNAIVAARRRWIKQATPLWLLPEHHAAIRALYLEAQHREGEWHVDHIVPLRGKLVCGLNVPWNMRVITGDHNRKKGNKHGPEYLQRGDAAEARSP